MGLLTKILGDLNSKEVKRLEPLASRINSYEKDIEKLSDAKLKAKTEDFKKRLEKGEGLNDILPEAFAVVREASKRTIGSRHYDVQLMGGIVLHQGRIAEMKTGEGKTLMATLATYLNALPGKGVHVVTVNDYLAKRDAGWMGRIHNFLGLSVAAIVHDKSYLYDPEFENKSEEDLRIANLREITRKEAYSSDITYGTNNEFGFDYLRDNMVQDLEQMSQRELNFAIVDEVDSILIDEARTPLIISASAAEATDKYTQFASLVKKLNPEKDYAIDEKMNAATLTDEGISHLEKLLGVENIYAQAEGFETIHHLEQALKARALFTKDKDYVVKDNEVIIVDEFTGRLMPGRRFSEGLHQAIEAKEGVRVQQESITLATVSFQNYFRLYKKLAGMTGTAATEAEEFSKIYKLEVTTIPTHNPMIRDDMNDLIYKTFEAKMDAVVEDIAKRHKKGQPVLIGTVSIEKNEYLSKKLSKKGIKHEVLNAKNHEKEALIIAGAGVKDAVTVATNMAGRGTDIVLGDGVQKLGGLHVIGTERHESRRIDNQLRGRSGRQGDPGSTQFYISLEDDLMRIFGSDRIGGIMSALKLPEDVPIEHSMVSKSIESAQKKVEGHNFDIRKYVVEYDDVMNRHRESIYSKRRAILSNETLKDEILSMFDNEVEMLVKSHYNAETGKIDYVTLGKQMHAIVPSDDRLEKEMTKYREEGLVEYLGKYLRYGYEQKEKEITTELMRVMERAVYLKVLDSLWIEHLEAMEHLRDSTGLRGYAQKDPLVEYKSEAYRLYQGLLAAIEQQIVYSIFKYEITRSEPAPNDTPLTAAAENAQGNTEQIESSLGSPAETAEEKPKPVKNNEKIGRNDPCFCGSGKKYKKCHGKDA